MRIFLGTPGGGSIVECRQVTFDVKSAGLRRERRQSTYAFDRAGHLVSADLGDHLGNRLSILAGDDVVSFDGRNVPLPEPVTLVLERNMVALIAVLLEAAGTGSGGTFHALAPETGTLLPYRIDREDAFLRGSMHDEYHLDDAGRISRIDVAASEFAFVRMARAFPGWSLDGVSADRAYRPPETIRVEDVDLEFGETDPMNRAATLARPLRESETLAGGVFIGGTGVCDRHGRTSGIDIGYHRLLDDLAGLGLASLRYEKFDPSAATLEQAESALDFDRLCRDARQAGAWLRQQEWTETIPRLAVGHSLGGLVALHLAAQESTCPDGVLLLNTPGRPFRRIMAEQQGWALQQVGTSQETEREISALNRAFIAALEREEDWTDVNVDSRFLPLRRRRRLYRQILDLDPAHLVRRGTCPVVIVQGNADVQVSVKDAERLADACRDAGRPHRLLIGDGLDHLLKRNRETGLAALRVYGDRRRRVPMALLRRIVRAIQAVLG